jgi:hypothetical protein
MTGSRAKALVAGILGATAVTTSLAAPGDVSYTHRKVTTGLLGTTTVAQVIVSGDRAQMTFVDSDNPVFRARAEIWLDNGSKHLVLDLDRPPTTMPFARARCSHAAVQTCPTCANR